MQSQEYRPKGEKGQFTPSGDNQEEIKEPQDPQNDNPEDSSYKKPDRNAMKLKGLPYSVTKEDVVKFFHGLGLVDDSVKIGVMADGKLTGEACVLFETVDDCQQAYTQQNH